jgi:ArsR family transcriptional regulator
MIDNLSEFFKGLGDVTRQRIINLLLHHQAMNVNELCRTLNEPQSKISRHLTILRNSKWLVNYRRDHWVFYRINSDVNHQLQSVLRELFESYLRFQTDLVNSRKNL